jgi:predicted nucleotidyltransferase
MNIFDKLVNSRLVESVVDLARDELDPTVFTFREDGSPVLKESLRIQILNDIDQIRHVLPVVNFYIIGSILTKNYTDDTDIDVTVQVDAQLVDSIATAEVMHLLKTINGRLAGDSRHPINYYIITDEYDQDKADAIYDVANDKWIKTPKHHDPNIDKWTSKFHDTLASIDVATGELRRDLIDLEELKELKTKDIKKLKKALKEKLSQIEELTKQLVTKYHDVRTLRHMAFDRFLTPQELQVYGSQNKLPENVLYKLLEKYYYLRMIRKLESILDERDELDLTDAAEVKKAMSGLWKTS